MEVRVVFGQAVWTAVNLVPPAMSTFHQDTTVAPGVTYDYRVRAVGTAGPGPWSAIATATAPSSPLDVTPPVVSIVNPANGATVSGIVSISAQATDNVGVEYLEISFSNQYTGQQVILGTASNAGTLSASWNTSGLTPAAYTVRAYAYDALGSWSQADISVNVASSTAESLKVSSISLAARVKVSRIAVIGNVYIKNSAGAPSRCRRRPPRRGSLPRGS